MPILPNSIILPLPILLNSTCDTDFDRQGSCNGPKIHPIKRHYPTLHLSQSNSEIPLADRKVPAAYEPPYPRVSKTKQQVVPDLFNEERTRELRTGLRGFPTLNNVESLRSLSTRSGTGEEMILSPFVGIPKVIKVIDPKSETGALMRLRRGVEVDFLKFKEVQQLNRLSGTRDPEEVVEKMRGGIGYNKPLDGLSRDVERSDKFWTDKPQRWFADPNGRAVKVYMTGDTTLAPQSDTTKHQISGKYRSQQSANRHALKKLMSKATSMKAK